MVLAILITLFMSRRQHQYAVGMLGFLFDTSQWSLDWWNNAMWFVLHESNTSSPIRYVDDLLNRRRNDEYSNWSAGCILCCCSFLAKSLVFFAGVRASCPKGPWTEPRSFNWLLNFFNSPQACDLKTTACPALTRLIGYMSLHAPYAYGAWLKAC